MTNDTKTDREIAEAFADGGMHEVIAFSNRFIDSKILEMLDHMEAQDIRLLEMEEEIAELRGEPTVDPNMEDPPISWERPDKAVLSKKDAPK